MEGKKEVTQVVGVRYENNAAFVLTKHSGHVSNKGIRHHIVNCEGSFLIFLELAKNCKHTLTYNNHVNKMVKSFQRSAKIGFGSEAD
jgi:hypothetical protein